MKSFTFFFVLFCASVASAQREKPVRLDADRHQVQPMPSAFGRRAFLNSWVRGWELTGTRVDAYEIACDEVFTDCAIPLLRTRAFKSEPLGMGSLTHSESALTWRGRRVEVRAELRGGRIEGWAGLWMRVDGRDGTVMAFDNMQNRPLRGTTSFQWYSVVLDVPAEAERLTFGVLLHGPGAVFIREIAFGEVEDEKTAVTDLIGALRPQSQ